MNHPVVKYLVNSEILCVLMMEFSIPLPTVIQIIYDIFLIIQNTFLSLFSSHVEQLASVS